MTLSDPRGSLLGDLGPYSKLIEDKFVCLCRLVLYVLVSNL
jgi:hypothetical protein